MESENDWNLEIIILHVCTNSRQVCRCLFFSHSMFSEDSVVKLVCLSYEKRENDTWSLRYSPILHAKEIRILATMLSAKFVVKMAGGQLFDSWMCFIQEKLSNVHQIRYWVPSVDYMDDFLQP